MHARASVCARARVRFGFVYQCVRVCACVCVCVCVREREREYVCARTCVCACVCVFACVRRFVCVYQCVAPPCTDQKRGPKSRLLLNLIPGHHFAMFSTSLYSDVRTKEARKEFANS